MMNLFEQFKAENKITDAILVGKNLFNKNPDNYDVFNSYFDFLCYLAEMLPDIEERKMFADQANTALAFYAENAELTKDMVEHIDASETRLNNIVNAIVVAEEAIHEENYNNLVSKNEKILANLLKMKEKLSIAKTQKIFDELLVEVKNIENGMVEDILTEKQKALYDKLTKEYTDTISSKMMDFERDKNIEYNKKAVDSYYNAFERFKNDENKYKKQDQLFELVSNSLFAYDSSKLFNETLIYYNHIYSYIFAKLDDKGKLALTRYSIECEQNRRHIR